MLSSMPWVPPAAKPFRAASQIFSAAAFCDNSNSDNSQEDAYGHECDLLSSYGTQDRQPLASNVRQHNRDDGHRESAICLDAFHQTLNLKPARDFGRGANRICRIHLV